MTPQNIFFIVAGLMLLCCVIITVLLTKNYMKEISDETPEVPMDRKYQMVVIGLGATASALSAGIIVLTWMKGSQLR